MEVDYFECNPTSFNGNRVYTISSENEVAECSGQQGFYPLYSQLWPLNPVIEKMLRVVLKFFFKYFCFW